MSQATRYNPISTVIDTNVLVAGLRSTQGNSHKLLQLIGKGLFDMNVSVPLILEYESVLVRHAAHLNLSRNDVETLIDYWCSIAIHHDIHYLWRPMLKDPKDEMVLELAVASGCNSIVTFNHKDFTRADSLGVTTISPLQFLETLGASRHDAH
jgi:putative PIN family toxin of toxin-antitoxin system